MAIIKAFHGLRYDLGHVGDLSDVVAPACDLVDSDDRKRLYERHPANIIRLISNRDEPGDGTQSRYERAARFLKNWQRERLLQTENQASIYVYHQRFTYGDVEYTRRGFMCRTRLETCDEVGIYPRAESDVNVTDDQRRLMQTCKANLSPILGLYPDDENETQELADQTIVGVTPLQAADDQGVIHRVWPINDGAKIAQLAGLMGPRAILVADGHHRYKAAYEYRQQLIQEQGELPTDHPANYVLMMCVCMDDPGLIVRPSHRLFPDAPVLSSDELVGKIRAYFDTRIAGEGTDLAELLWDEIESDNDQGKLALYSGQDERWVLAKINETGRTRMCEIASHHSEEWRDLGVSILHRLILVDCLGLNGSSQPTYARSVHEVIRELENGDTFGRPKDQNSTGQTSANSKFALAALVLPATLDHVRMIRKNGERLPAGSTDFYPNLLSGFVMNPVE